MILRYVESGQVGLLFQSISELSSVLSFALFFTDDERRRPDVFSALKLGELHRILEEAASKLCLVCKING